MNNIKEQVVWKSYPEYPFIEANQFGEIRMKDRCVRGRNESKRLIKGHVLKQHINPLRGGYVYVTFGINGKQIHLYVHRIVATCFIPNHNNYPEVNHIDNDPTNNAVSNLEWCTSQDYQDYKKNFGTSQAEITGHSVFAVDLETGKVLRFESQSEAARQLGVDQSNVTHVVKGKRLQTGGYLFVEDESEITEEKIREIRASTHFLGGVVAVNSETSEAFWFDSQSEAGRQLGINSGNINMVVKGQRDKAGGFCFYHADRGTVEKVRVKFGDEIANKVEELIERNSHKKQEV